VVDLSSLELFRRVLHTPEMIALSPFFLGRPSEPRPTVRIYVMKVVGTRAPRDARHRWTRPGGGERNELHIPTPMYDTCRATGLRRHLVAVARPLLASLRMSVFSRVSCPFLISV